MRTRTALRASVALALIAVAAVIALELVGRSGGGDPPSRPDTAGTMSPAVDDRHDGTRPPSRRRPVRAAWRMRAAGPPEALAAAGLEAGSARRAELEARGLTPIKLFASRTGGQLTAAGIMARQLGDAALADEAEALGRAMWALTGPQHPYEPDPDLDELLAAESELVERLYVFAERHREEPLLGALVARVNEDMMATMSGQPRDIEDKLAEEEAEPASRRGDDDAEDAARGKATTAGGGG